MVAFSSSVLGKLDCVGADFLRVIAFTEDMFCPGNYGDKDDEKN